MQQLRWRIMCATALATLALIAASCGSDETVEGPDSTPPATATPADPEPTETATATQADAEPLSDEMDGGTYTSAVLGTPVTFTLEAPLDLVEERSGLIALGLPDASSDGVVLFLRPDGVIVPAEAGEVAGGDNETRLSQAPYPGDLGAFLAESPQVDIVHSGRGATGQWWEVATSEGADLVDVCSLGRRCTPVVSYGDDELLAIAEAGGITTRIYEARSPEGDPLLLVAQGQNNAAELVATAEAIVGSLCFCGPPAPPTPTPAPSPPRPLEELTGVTPIPAGSYVIDFHASSLSFDLADEISDVVVVVIDETQSFAVFELWDGGEPAGILHISDGELIAPAATGANAHPDRGRVERAGDVTLSTWAASVEPLAVLASGSEITDGGPVDWVDIEIVEELVSDTTTFACFEDLPEAPPGREDARCISLAQGTSGSSGLMVGQRVRLFGLPAQGVHVKLEARAVDDLDRVGRTALRVLDGLTVEPAPESDREPDSVEVTHAEFLAEVRAVPPEPDLDAFCAEFVGYVPPSPGNTPEELEADVEAVLARDQRVTRSAPLEIRPSAELVHAGNMKLRADLAKYGFDVNAAPPSVFMVHPDIGMANGAVEAFAAEHCET